MVRFQRGNRQRRYTSGDRGTTRTDRYDLGTVRSAGTTDAVTFDQPATAPLLGASVDSTFDAFRRRGCLGGGGAIAAIAAMIERRVDATVVGSSERSSCDVTRLPPRDGVVVPKI